MWKRRQANIVLVGLGVAVACASFAPQRYSGIRVDAAPRGFLLGSDFYVYSEPDGHPYVFHVLELDTRRLMIEWGFTLALTTMALVLASRPPAEKR